MACEYTCDGKIGARPRSAFQGRAWRHWSVSAGEVADGE